VKELSKKEQQLISWIRKHVGELNDPTQIKHTAKYSIFYTSLLSKRVDIFGSRIGKPELNKILKSLVDHNLLVGADNNHGGNRHYAALSVSGFLRKSKIDKELSV
jgi:hypothetical protein